MRTLFSPLAPFAIVLLSAAARADEGMWTYNNFPKERVQRAYGFAPDDKWLEHARLASARIAGGCSASFVSEGGLVMTNHHCVHECVEKLSSAKQDLIKSGFYARTAADEVKCPAMEVNQLVAITDVTERMRKATAGLVDQKYNEAEKAESSRIEKECATSDKVRCDVVSLYRGGIYNLYKYRRYQDVRLVFAPELAIAFFGGDPDNFMFPRYDLDASFVRVYEGDKPARTEHFFKWSSGGARDGDLTFVSGHPGGTSRQLTVAQLEYQRDVGLPDKLLAIAQWRGMLGEFGRRSAEAKRISTSELFGVENSFKALRGRHEALLDKAFFTSLAKHEQELRARVAKDPELAKKHGGAWDAIAKAYEELRKVRKPLGFIEHGRGFSSDLFGIARLLVRAADERPKPIEKRYREFADSRLPELTHHLFSPAPIYDELEIATLSFSLARLREELGADHPFVRKVLGKESPDEMAERLVKGSKLKDLALRKKLWDGGKKEVDASDDPMVKLARLIDADGRAVRKQYEDQIEAPIKKASEAIARARFAAEETSSFPDATFTLRLSYGTVKGYEENGRKVAPFTTIAGAYDRATGRPPFDLPESWLKSKDRLDLKTSFNFVTTNDIIGGNSGSPVVSQAGEIVGLVFDGNIQSLGGDYGFDPAVNRTVAVHSEAILHSLARIYNAERIVNELQPGARASRVP